MASLLIIAIVTLVCGTGFILFYEVCDKRPLRSLPSRMLKDPIWYSSEYVLCLLTGACVAVNYGRVSPLLVVIVATAVAGSVHMVLEASEVKIQEGSTTWSVLRHEMLNDGSGLLLHFGTTFFLAWIYFGALHWFG